MWTSARSPVADLPTAHAVLDWEKVRRRQECIFEISSTLPRDGGAHAAQLCCDTSTPAAARSLSPAGLSCSLRHGLALPRLPGSHAFVPVFSRLFLLLHGRSSAVWFSQEGASFPFPPHAHAHTPKGTELTFSSSLQTFVFPLFGFQCSSSKYTSTETRQRYQESTCVLKIALEQLFFSLCSFAHSSVPSIYSSVANRGPAVATAVLIDRVPLELIIWFSPPFRYQSPFSSLESFLPSTRVNILVFFNTKAFIQCRRLAFVWVV